MRHHILFRIALILASILVLPLGGCSEDPVTNV
jgi:hypothetical protein